MLDFIKDFQSVVMGTLDDKGMPFGSYAPFVHTEHKFYVFISNVAKHAINLQRTPTASLVFIEDETKAEQIFARKRVSLQCSSAMVQKEDKKFMKVMDVFKTKFSPDMVEMLMGMSDFNLYEFSTTYGEATYGFGEAYNIGGDFMEDLVKRTGGTGHGHGHKKT